VQRYLFLYFAAKFFYHFFFFIVFLKGECLHRGKTSAPHFGKQEMTLFLPFFPSFPSFFSHFALILSNIPKTFVIFVKKLPENLERVIFCYTFASAFGQKTPAWALRGRMSFFERFTWRH